MFNQLSKLLNICQSLLWQQQSDGRRSNHISPWIISAGLKGAARRDLKCSCKTTARCRVSHLTALGIKPQQLLFRHLSQAAGAAAHVAVWNERDESQLTKRGMQQLVVVFYLSALIFVCTLKTEFYEQKKSIKIFTVAIVTCSYIDTEIHQSKKTKIIL